MALINENSVGTTREYIGQPVEIVSEGANAMHLIVRWPGERRTWGCPVTWLDRIGEKPRRALRVKRSVIS
jgi:hypothetical protein